jgi:hypothetical protein
MGLGRKAIVNAQAGWTGAETKTVRGKHKEKMFEEKRGKRGTMESRKLRAKGGRRGGEGASVCSQSAV